MGFSAPYSHHTYEFLTPRCKLWHDDRMPLWWVRGLVEWHFRRLIERQLGYPFHGREFRLLWQ